MICPTCGINSTTEDVCSFCHHPIPKPGAAPPPPPPPYRPAPTMQMPAANPPGAQYRTTLTGEVIEVAAPPPSPGQTPTMAMPTMGMPTQSMQAQPGRPYQGPPQSAPVGPYALPTAAYTPQFVKETLAADEGQSPGERWELFLAIGLPILAASMALVHFMPNLILWVAIADLFFLSMAMSGTCAIPSYDDSFADCSLALILCFLFGPFIAGVALMIAGLVKQEPNNAVLSLLSLIVFLQIVFRYALMGSNAGLGSLLMFVGLFNILGIFAVFVAFAGWMFGNFFRPVNEA